MPSTKPFVPSLTGIRFVAALMVMLGHGSGMMPSSMAQGVIAFYIAQITSIGMSLFFVLSGFVIWINYADIFRKRPFAEACWDFAVARFARLYPMYICIIPFAVAVSGMYLFFKNMPWPLFYFPMMQAWIPGGHGLMAAFGIAWAGHLWSVSTEVFFYATFPFVVFAFWRLGSIRNAAIAAVANFALCCILYYLAFRIGPRIVAAGSIDTGGDGMMWLTYYSPYLRVFEFFAGCLAASLFMMLRGADATKRLKRFERSFAIAIVLSFLALPAFLIAIRYLPGQEFRLQFAARLGSLALFPLLLIHISLFDSFLSRFLSTKIMLWGGESSYSIYLLHTFFIDHFSFHPGDHVYPGEYFFRLAVYASLITIISWGTFIWIEKPARTYIRSRLVITKSRSVGTTATPEGTAALARPD
jgi:peptidoglycan/LPS O-acetylase OafA/YrhL